MRSDKVTHMHAFGTNATYIDYRTYHNAQYISTAGCCNCVELQAFDLRYMFRHDVVHCCGADGNKTAKLEKKKMHIETTIIVASYNQVWWKCVLPCFGFYCAINAITQKRALLKCIAIFWQQKCKTLNRFPNTSPANSLSYNKFGTKMIRLRDEHFVRIMGI